MMKTTKNTCVVIKIDSVKRRETTFVVDKQQAKRLLVVKNELLPLLDVGFGAVIEVEREEITNRVVGVELIGYCAGSDVNQELKEKYFHRLELE